MQFTLADRDNIDHGDLLSQADLDFANELLAKGESYIQVLTRLRGWAADYDYERFAESQAACDFEDRSY